MSPAGGGVGRTDGPVTVLESLHRRARRAAIQSQLPIRFITHLRTGGSVRRGFRVLRPRFALDALRIRISSAPSPSEVIRMAERTSNVEFAHRIHEHGHSGSHSHSDWLEIVE